MPKLFEKCAGGICHSTEDGLPPGGGVDFYTAAFPGDLIDQDATYPDSDPGECPSMPEKIIDAANPAQSLILLKLRGTQSCGTGMPQPYPAKGLSAREIQCFEDWVLEVTGTSGDGAGGAAL